MMGKADDLLLETLTKKGWTVTKRPGETCDLPGNIAERYHNIPVEYTEFLEKNVSCVNPDETAWLLGLEDFKEQGKDAFRWNEFEIMSLEAAAEAEDAEWQEEIKKFWDNHLPVCISVGGGYGYYAIRISDGCIVHGMEPEFEGTKDAAGSFHEFIELVCAGKIKL